MSKPLVGRAVLNALKDYFATFEVLRTVRERFEEQGITHNEAFVPQENGQRRYLVEQYYATLDLTKGADARKVMALIENILNLRNRSGLFEDDKVRARMETVLRFDGYKVINEDGALRVVYRLDSSPVGQALQATMSRLDATTVREAWEKAVARCEEDPEGAITSARTLLESTCKTILEDCGEDSDTSGDLGKLYKAAARCLKLTPDLHTEQVIKQILSGCFSVAAGLASLRNAMSDAHGAGRSRVKPVPRHARLAVNVAGSLCLFLMETHERDRGQS